MSTTATLPYEERQERARRFAQFLIYGPREPMEPMATRAEVLEEPCTACGVQPGEECKGWPPSLLGRAFPELRGIHTRRYLDRTHDPR